MNHLDLVTQEPDLAIRRTTQFKSITLTSMTFYHASTTFPTTAVEFAAAVERIEREEAEGNRSRNHACARKQKPIDNANGDANNQSLHAGDAANDDQEQQLQHREKAGDILRRVCSETGTMRGRIAKARKNNALEAAGAEGASTTSPGQSIENR
jgi:hypothetical protein